MSNPATSLMTPRLISINHEVCRRLMEHKNNLSSHPSGPFHPPYYSVFNKNIGDQQRISEQEARFCYVQYLNELYNENKTEMIPSNIFYTVETPTTNKYSFTGDNDLSARIDLSLFLYSNMPDVNSHPDCNIEFKFGPAPDHAIAKDIQKLIGEGVLGSFFHLIDESNKDTLSSLYEKFKAALLIDPSNATATTTKGFNKRENIKYKKEKDDYIIFTFCILQWKEPLNLFKSWAVSKIYNILNDNPANFFKWMTDDDPFDGAKKDGWYHTP